MRKLRKKTILNNRTWRAVSLLMLLFTLVLSETVFAASPEFARTKEEWEILRDNTLSYAEIPDLVEEYNPTVISNQISYSTDEMRMKNAVQTNDALDRMADEYDQLSAEMEGTTGGALTAASFRLMADQLRSQAMDNTSDSRVIRLGYEKMQAEIVKNVKDLYVNYHRLLAARELAAANTAYMEQSWHSAENRNRYGLATELDVLKALEAYQSAVSQQAETEKELSLDYHRLITSCGWKYEAEAVIEPVPAFTAEELLAADKEKDLETSLEKSNTLSTDRIRLENAKTLSHLDAARKMEETLTNDTNTVKASFLGAYEDLMLKKTLYDGAMSDYQAAASNRQAAEKKLQLGMISPVEYAGVEYSFAASRYQADSAWYDLILSRIAYDAIVEGLS